MPRCLPMKEKFLRDAAAGELLDQAAAHGADAIAHAGKFVFPHLAQLGRVQHRRHHRAAVDRRVGVIADDALDLGHDAGRFCPCRRSRWRAPTRSPYSEKDLEKELETKNCRPDAVKARIATASASMPSAALVGHVEEGHEAARAAGVDDFVPLGIGEVGAGGLWQQACSTMIEPAGRLSSFAFMAAKFTPRVLAS